MVTGGWVVVSRATPGCSWARHINRRGRAVRLRKGGAVSPVQEHGDVPDEESRDTGLRAVPASG